MGFHTTQEYEWIVTVGTAPSVREHRILTERAGEQTELPNGGMLSNLKGSAMVARLRLALSSIF